MKILLRTLGIVVIISLLGFLSYGIYKKKEEKADVKKWIESLPAFSLNSLKGEDVTAMISRVRRSGLFSFIPIVNTARCKLKILVKP